MSKAEALQGNIGLDSIDDFDFDHLRPIAKKQIRILLRKMEFTHNYSLYTAEIKKVLQYELQGGDSKHE